MHASVNNTDPKTLARLATIEPPALAVAGLLALAALALWRFPALAAQISPVWAELRPPTATALLFITIALALSRPRVPPAANAVAGGIALGLMLTVCFGFLARSGILGVPADRLANLPQPSNMVVTLFAAVALLWNREATGLRSLAADVGAMVALVALLFLIGGYIFEGIVFTGAVHAPLQSPPTIAAVTLLTLVLASRRATAGSLFGFLTSTGIGSRIARTVLPAVTLMPFVLFEALAALERSGHSVAFSRAFLAPVVAIVCIAVVVWMGRRANWIEDHLRRQSVTDQLTGLLNRRGFEDATLRLGGFTDRRTATGVIAFFFDLDNLKRANDLLGHTAGSEVIQRFADLLAVTFRKTDVIGRVGGDEFVVIAPAPVETAEEILGRLARVVETLNATEYLVVPISYSVGYAELPPGDVGDLESLIAEADARMYAEKSRKRAA